MTDRKEAAATQKFVEIAGVKNGTVILKGGGLRQILVVGGINFDLKSEEEQGIIISLFQGFLNSLSFSVQIVVHSRKLNIGTYLENLTARYEQETNELLKNQIQEYREFIRALVAENTIMNKDYFVVIPFDPVSVPGVGQVSGGGGILGFLKKPPPAGNTPSAADDARLAQQIEQLNQRTAHVIQGIGHVGLRVVQLNDQELIELFYNLYNPEATEKKELSIVRNEQTREEPQPKK